MTEKITGIILAGGQSKRMGTDKGLIGLSGKPLISYAIDTLSGICGEILISANDDAYNSFGLKVVPDLMTGQGPMGGIYSCMKAVKTKYVIVLSCDMPFVDKQIIDLLLTGKNHYQAVLPGHKGFMQPVCALYNSEILPIIEHHLFSGKLKLAGFIEMLNHKIVEISYEDEYKLLSINTKSELLEAERMILNLKMKSEKKDID
jgi:molybdopterin-guanine dinucleotide biosynthesis protein A